MTHSDLFERLVEATQEAADRFQSARVEAPYYIIGDDEGISYCYDCAQRRLAELQPSEDQEAFYELGGGGWPEEDGQEYCETCRAPLAVVYTDYGVQQMLCSFEDDGLKLSVDEDCYIMQRVLHGITPDDTVTVQRVEQLAVKCLSAIDSQDGQS
jgi:hypothetical protein